LAHDGAVLTSKASSDTLNPRTRHTSDKARTELMNEERLEAARTTHPTLRSDVVFHANLWTELTEKDKNLAAWQQKHFGPGVYSELVRALFASEDALAHGDTSCFAVFPVLHSNYDGPLVDEDAKVKKPGNLVPSLLVATERYLANLLWLGGGWTDLIYPTSAIKSARKVKAGGALVVPKYPSLLFDIDEDGESDRLLLAFAQFLPDDLVVDVRDKIRTALAGS
jgi:hypothetical protein